MILPDDLAAALRLGARRVHDRGGERQCQLDDGRTVLSSFHIFLLVVDVRDFAVGGILWSDHLLFSGSSHIYHAGSVGGLEPAIHRLN
jgi:hypothetical protein